MAAWPVKNKDRSGEESVALATVASLSFLPEADSYDPKTGIRKTGEMCVSRLDQSGVAGLPYVEFSGTPGKQENTWNRNETL